MLPEGIELLTPIQRKYYDGAIQILDELETRGFKYNRVHKILAKENVRYGWGAHTLTVIKGGQDSAVAHELGHAFHEGWRTVDSHGEAFANAIRWFVEQRIGVTDWCRQAYKSGTNDEVLNKCEYNFEKFIQLLKQAKED